MYKPIEGFARVQEGAKYSTVVVDVVGDSFLETVKRMNSRTVSFETELKAVRCEGFSPRQQDALFKYLQN